MEEIESLVKKVTAADVAAEERLAAFGEIVRRYQDMAYGCAYAILGDFHLAEDAAQEAFLAAYRELPNLREARALPGWLRRIVVTQCSRMTRGKRVSTTGLDAAVTVASGNLQPPEALEKQEMEDKVLSAIRQLPENQRMVTTLFYINGYSQTDIAEFLEVPVTTVKKRLVTARGRLKQRMMKMVDETLKSFPLSGDFADVVVRKAASQEDLKQAAALLSYSGKKRPGDFGSPANADKAGVYIVGEEGSVEAAGYFNETKFSIGSVVLKAARPNEMGAEAAGVPDPAFVKGFQGCCKLAKQQGIHLAVAHGSQYDHAFCGFVPCFYYPVATMPCEAAKSIVTRATITEADQKQSETASQACLCDPYSPKMSAYIGGGVWHVIRQDGKVVGYVRVNRDFDPAKKCDMPFGYITDVTVQTREAALAVLRIGTQLAEAAGEKEFCVMQSHMTLITQAMLALGGTYFLRGSCDLVGLDAEMVAIIDLAGLAKNLEGEFQSRLRNSAFTAAFSIEMGGATVGFMAKAGRLEIVTGKQKVHRLLPRWVTTRLFTGYYSGEDVLAMGPIPWDRSDGRTPDDVKLDNKPLDMPEAEAALFAALFPKLWPVSWPDPDVWPWVIGKEHPRYQGEQNKTPEMKAQIDALRFPWIGF
ncbi:MAG: sigma-70 family RNA polymerase sigma factor [Phycisphaerae bacterium]|nr:sigma-70 family RNA polymerase sigma factor [Phycisphaerae bacterium]